MNLNIFNKPVNQLLSSTSGEFIDKKIEKYFLTATWSDYKTAPKNAMFIGGIIFIAFLIVDLLSGVPFKELQTAIGIRLLAGSFLLASAYYIHRANNYFSHYHILTLAAQIVIAIAVIYIGRVRDLIFIHSMCLS